MALLMVTLAFAVEAELPMTKPLKLAMLLIVMLAMEPVPAKFVVPDPLQVNGAIEPELFVNALP